MLKYLRIAVTTLSLTACVPLIALWVRSNWYVDGFWFPTPLGFGIGLISIEKCASLTLERGIPDADYMHFESYDVNQNSNLRPATHFGFLFAREPGGMYGYVPYWFLLGLMACMAAAPWMRCQFKLRTLLLATVLVAVGLAIIVMSR